MLEVTHDIVNEQTSSHQFPSHTMHRVRFISMFRGVDRPSVVPLEAVALDLCPLGLALQAEQAAIQAAQEKVGNVAWTGK